MNDWQNSNGAQMEKLFAEKTGRIEELIIHPRDFG
jgi:hypothetical protein